MKVMPHREPRCVWLELNDPYVPCIFVSQRYGIQDGMDALAENTERLTLFRWRYVGHIYDVVVQIRERFEELGDLRRILLPVG